MRLASALTTKKLRCSHFEENLLFLLKNGHFFATFPDFHQNFVLTFSLNLPSPIHHRHTSPNQPPATCLQPNVVAAVAAASATPPPFHPPPQPSKMPPSPPPTRCPWAPTTTEPPDPPAMTPPLPRARAVAAMRASNLVVRAAPRASLTPERGEFPFLFSLSSTARHATHLPCPCPATQSRPCCARR